MKYTLLLLYFFQITFFSKKKIGYYLVYYVQIYNFVAENDNLCEG